MKTLNMPKFYFYAFVLMTIVFIITNPMKAFWGETQYDEKVYKNISQDFDSLYTTPDNKPIFFLYLQKLLDADTNKTRALNIILIIICTYLIFKITNSKTAFLYPIIPIFLNSMWLTVEIIEIMFLLLSFRYVKCSGLFIGLASVFRPYALLYSVLLNKNQRIYFLAVLLLAVIYLAYINYLGIYVTRLIGYGLNERDAIDYLSLAWLILWLIIGLTFKQTIADNTGLWKYVLISIAPLYIKMYGHYFLVPYTLLFLGYLLSYKSKEPIIKELEV